MNKRIIVFKGEQYDNGFPPTDATECVRWFQEKLEAIPVEYREGARIEIESVGSYEDSHYATVEVYYDRPETPAEEAERMGRDVVLAKQREQQERTLLAKLQAKYGAQ